MTTGERCDRPPPGWWCSRDPNHDGPCAARQICVMCNPELFENDPRPKMFLPLCDEHLSQVKPLTDDEIDKAVEQGRRDREAVEQEQRYFHFPWHF